MLAGRAGFSPVFLLSGIGVLVLALSFARALRRRLNDEVAAGTQG